MVSKSAEAADAGNKWLRPTPAPPVDQAEDRPRQENQNSDLAKSPEVISPNRGQGKMVRKVRASGKVHFMAVIGLMGERAKGRGPFPSPNSYSFFLAAPVSKKVAISR